MIKKICEICKKEFDAPTKNSHICKECQSKTDACPICGKPKSIFAKTCSRSCGTKLMFQTKQKIQSSKKEENLQKTLKRSGELRQKLDKLQKLIDAGIYDDFEEIPVSIEEFITNRDYLGNSWLDANDKLKAFPFWVEQAKKIFPLPLRSPYHTIILEGATGLGKTSFAVNMLLAYYLYIVMCLKDPHEYFDLADQKKITFAFINIVTKTMAYKNAWGMLHKALSRSPWFMQRGAMTTERNPTWYSTTKEVDLLYGGSPNDLIGLDLLCLVGNTEILTEDGWRKLEDLEKQTVRVETYNNKLKRKELSEVCHVIKTKETTELFEIELEDGSKIRCTPEHRFLLKTGEYKAAKDLDELDELEDGEMSELREGD